MEPGFNDVVKESWFKYKTDPILERLNRCGEDMFHWSRANGGRFQKDLEDCRKQLELMCNSHVGESQDQLLHLRKKMNQYLLQDEAY